LTSGAPQKLYLLTADRDVIQVCSRDLTFSLVGLTADPKTALTVLSGHTRWTSLLPTGFGCSLRI